MKEWVELALKLLEHSLKPFPQELNELDLMERWVYLAKILNNVHLRDIENLNPAQRSAIKDFLERQNNNIITFRILLE